MCAKSPCMSDSLNKMQKVQAVFFGQLFLSCYKPFSPMQLTEEIVIVILLVVWLSAEFQLCWKQHVPLVKWCILHHTVLSFLKFGQRVFHRVYCTSSSFITVTETNICHGQKILWLWQLSKRGLDYLNASDQSFIVLLFLEIP